MTQDNRLLTSTIERVRKIPSRQLLLLDDFLTVLEQSVAGERNAPAKEPAYLRARAALTGCQGSLSEDIRLEREARP